VGSDVSWASGLTFLDQAPSAPVPGAEAVVGHDEGGGRGHEEHAEGGGETHSCSWVLFEDWKTCGDWMLAWGREEFLEVVV
jgi:hypothetical protein